MGNKKSAKRTADCILKILLHKSFFTQIDKNREMAPGKKKTGNDSKPSTSKGTANSEENIRPKRQATKKVKPGAMLEEDDSSSDDFEPSPPKAVKKSPQKPSKKDMKKSPTKPSKKDSKKSQKKATTSKEKKILSTPIMDTNANFEDTTISKDKNIIL